LAGRRFARIAGSILRLSVRGGNIAPMLAGVGRGWPGSTKRSFLPTLRSKSKLRGTMKTGYQHEKDYARLSRQVVKVAGVMSDHKWRTLAEIAGLTGCPEASISARLRGLRQSGNTVDKRRRGEATRGIWEYRIAPLGALTAAMIDHALPIQTIERWI